MEQIELEGFVIEKREFLPKARMPKVTVSRHGIGLNRKAVELLGDPDYVYVIINKKADMILFVNDVLREEDNDHSRMSMKLNSLSNGRKTLVSCDQLLIVFRERLSFEKIKRYVFIGGEAEYDLTPALQISMNDFLAVASSSPKEPNKEEVWT